MQLSERQWNALSRMLGGNSEFSNRVSTMSPFNSLLWSTITLKRLSDVQDSYLLIYSDNPIGLRFSIIEVEIHRYSDVSKYDLSCLHTLWNLWVARNYPNYPI